MNNKSVVLVNKKSEKIKFLVNTLIRKCKSENIKVLAVSSSIEKTDMPEILAKKTAEIANDFGISATCICFDNDGIKNKNEFSHAIEEASKNHELVLAAIPSIRIFADAIICAEKCDAAVLAEKYRYTHYKKYEKTLLFAKENGIKILGTAACK